MEQLQGIGPVGLAGLLVLLAIEFGLMIFAVVDWVKRPADQFNGNRFVWLAVIVLFNIVGPIVYLAAGRKAPAAAEVTPQTPVADRAEAAADALYGSATQDQADR